MHLQGSPTVPKLPSIDAHTLTHQRKPGLSSLADKLKGAQHNKPLKSAQPSQPVSVRQPPTEGSAGHEEQECEGGVLPHWAAAQRLRSHVHARVSLYSGPAGLDMEMRAGMPSCS